MKTFSVTAHWDQQAGVWWADSEEIPGLTVQAESLEMLDNTVRDLAPDLLRLNLGVEEPVEIKLIHETV